MVLNFVFKFLILRQLQLMRGRLAFVMEENVTEEKEAEPAVRDSKEYAHCMEVPSEERILTELHVENVLL